MRPKTSTVRACIDCGAILTGHGHAIRCPCCAAKELWRRRVRRGPSRIEAVCPTCGSTFFPRATVVARGGGKYCSRPCARAVDRSRPLVVRCWSKVDRHGPIPAHRPELGPCWPWTGAVLPNGYGVVNAGGHDGNTLLAHRAVYSLVRGPIPEGLDLDHLCRNRGCVNPDHLEPVTPSENLRRGAYDRARGAT